jgi:hypothetical protein
MKIIVNDLGLKLVPHREGLCFELYVWKPQRKVPSGRSVGTVALAGWVGLGVYPNDVPQGLEAMLKRAPHADPGVVRSIRTAIGEMRAAQQSVREALWASSAETGPPLHVQDLGYKVAPYPEGHCFQISRWTPMHSVRKGSHAAQPAAARWVSLGMYPSSVAQGMAKVLDLAINADPHKVGVEEASLLYQVAAKSILDANPTMSSEMGRCA